jgi:hypothetical protein
VLTLFSLRGSGSNGSDGESAVIEGEREGCHNPIFDHFILIIIIIILFIEKKK